MSLPSQTSAVEFCKTAADAIDEFASVWQRLLQTLMPYALSFSEDFFCDGDPEEVRPSHWPTSVYQAILSMSQAKWNEIARDVFHVKPDVLDPLILLDRIRQTNTCSNLESPVQVWIDREGFYDLLVYDGDRQAAQFE